MKMMRILMMTMHSFTALAWFSCGFIKNGWSYAPVDPHPLKFFHPLPPTGQGSSHVIPAISATVPLTLERYFLITCYCLILVRHFIHSNQNDECCEMNFVCSFLYSANSLFYCREFQVLMWVLEIRLNSPHWKNSRFSCHDFLILYYFRRLGGILSPTRSCLDRLTLQAFIQQTKWDLISLQSNSLCLSSLIREAFING